MILNISYIYLIVSPTAKLLKIFLVFYIIDDFYRRRAGDADVADRFELCRGIYIGDDGVVRVILLYAGDHLSVHLIGHLASREGLCEPYVLVGRENLAGFSHEAHAAHQNVFVADLSRVDAELVAVAGEVGDLTDFARDIAVREHTYVFFLF